MIGTQTDKFRTNMHCIDMHFASNSLAKQAFLLGLKRLKHFLSFFWALIVGMQVGLFWRLGNWSKASRATEKSESLEAVVGEWVYIGVCGCWLNRGQLGGHGVQAVVITPVFTSRAVLTNSTSHNVTQSNSIKRVFSDQNRWCATVAASLLTKLCSKGLKIRGKNKLNKLEPDKVIKSNSVFKVDLSASFSSTVFPIT